MTPRVDYVESVDSAIHGKHAVSNFGAILVELRVLVCEDLHLRMLTGNFLHEHCVPPSEVASLSQ